MRLTKEDYWKVLNNELSLIEIMKMFGSPPEEIDSVMNDIKSSDVHDSSSLFGHMMFYYSRAYKALVRLKEIDPSEMWPKKDKYWVGDIGFKGDGLYRFVNEEWQKL